MDIRGLKTLKAALLGLAASVACVLGTAQPANASFAFTDGGTGGTVITGGISGFNENAGNALGKNSITAIVAGPGNTFQLYFQTTVANFQPASGSGNGISITSGGTYTIVGSVTETVGTVTNSAGISTATFGVAASQASQSGLSIYYIPAAVEAANPVNAFTGANFGPGLAGAVTILTASPTPSVASNQNVFTDSLVAPFQTFNQVNPAHNTGVQTVFGNGAYQVQFATTSANASFFTSGAPSVLGVTITGNQNAAFANVEPSGLFTAPNGTTATPNIGTINGLGLAGATDFQFQTTGLLSAVPEPSSVCLMGLGLAGVLTYVHRKRNQDV
jgi:hypothetical protein